MGSSDSVEVRSLEAHDLRPLFKAIFTESSLSSRYLSRSSSIIQSKNQINEIMQMRIRVRPLGNQKLPILSFFYLLQKIISLALFNYIFYLLPMNAVFIP